LARIKRKVPEYGILYTKGMQDYGVMACVKAFSWDMAIPIPTRTHALPVINHDKKRMEEIELFPFRELFKAGAKSVMVAHIHIPAYDNEKNKATTLSKNVVTNLLKNKMDFEGLIFTDAFNMKGVSSFYKPGEVDVLAFLAGNDVLLFSEDVPTAIKEIKKAIR
jgi:beta-N-acetylhexosaminidase